MSSSVSRIPRPSTKRSPRPASSSPIGSFIPFPPSHAQDVKDHLPSKEEMARLEETLEDAWKETMTTNASANANITSKGFSKEVEIAALGETWTSSLESPGKHGQAAFQDIMFPPLRTVLWDRTCIGESYVLGAEAHVPKLVIRRAALASLYHFSRKYLHGRQEDGFLGRKGFPNPQSPVLVGEPVDGADPTAIGDWVGGMWEACVSTFNRDGASGFRKKYDTLQIFMDCGTRPTKEQEVKATEIMESGGYEQVFVERSPESESLCFSTEDYKRILGDVMERFHARGAFNATQYLCGYGNCLGLPGNRLVFRAEMILPALALEFSPITPLPILSTPLARQLDRWAASGAANKEGVSPDDPTGSGFLTLNQTRKAVFLLEDDPMAMELPIVGVWLRGSALPVIERESSILGNHNKLGDESWESLLSDPLLWSVCLRYIHNERIKEKVSPIEAPSTFLVAMYPRGSKMAHFVECRFSMFQEKESLGKLGMKPRPFLQLECCFEVDVGHDATRMFSEGNGHKPDSVSCHFYHVDNVEKRQRFQAALDEVMSDRDGPLYEPGNPADEASIMNGLLEEYLYNDDECDDNNDDEREDEGEEDHGSLNRFDFGMDDLDLGNDDDLDLDEDSPRNEPVIFNIYSDTPDKKGSGRDEVYSFSLSMKQNKEEKTAERPEESPKHEQQQNLKTQIRKNTARPPVQSTRIERKSVEPVSTTSSAAPSKYYDLLNAQQQQIQLMQQQIAGLQQLLEEQMKNSKENSPRPARRDESSHHMQESATAIYLQGLQQDDDDDNEENEEEGGENTIAPASSSSDDDGEEQNHEGEISSGESDVPISAAAVQQHFKSYRQKEEISKTTSFRAEDDSEAIRSNREFEGNSESSDDDDDDDVDENHGLYSSSQVDLTAIEPSTEADTEFGIPKIAFSHRDRGFDSDSGDDFGEADEDEWVAAIEQKYLAQIHNKKRR